MMMQRKRYLAILRYFNYSLSNAKAYSFTLPELIHICSNVKIYPLFCAARLNTYSTKAYNVIMQGAGS